MAEYDLVIANGRIVDGCGNPWFRGDSASAARRVAAVARPARCGRGASSTPPTAT